MLFRKSSSSPSRSYSKPSWSKPSVTVNKKSIFKLWKTEKPAQQKLTVQKKVVIQKNYNSYPGYGYQPVMPIVVPTGTVVHHYDDDDYVPVPYQGNGIGFFGFLTALLAVAVLGAVGFVAYKRFAHV